MVSFLFRLKNRYNEGLSKIPDFLCPVPPNGGPKKLAKNANFYLKLQILDKIDFEFKKLHVGLTSRLCTKT